MSHLIVDKAFNYYFVSCQPTSVASGSGNQATNSVNVYLITIKCISPAIVPNVQCYSTDAMWREHVSGRVSIIGNLGKSHLKGMALVSSILYRWIKLSCICDENYADFHAKHSHMQIYTALSE